MLRVVSLFAAALVAPALSAQAAVSPLPASHEVRLEFEGNHEVSTRRLRRALSALQVDLRRRGVDDAALEDAQYELESFYRDQGFRLAQVSGRWTRKEEGYELLFRIEEGPRSWLEEVVFLGNLSFPDGELADRFPWPRSGLFRLGRRVFTEDALEEGLARLTTLYELAGHPRVEVRSLYTENGMGEVRVAVIIDEGPRVWLRDLPVLEGVESFPPVDLIQAMNLQLPAPFAPNLPRVLQGRVEEHYRRRGRRWVRTEVESRVDLERGEARLRIRVEEGPPTTIEDVRLRGHVLTREPVIRRVIRLEPGDLYREDLVRRTHRNLLRTGLFSSVDVETSPVEGAADRVHLDIALTERPRYRLAFLAGYGSYELLRGGVVLEDGNLFGTGNRVRLDASGSFKGERLRGEYLNPFFFHELLSQRTQGFYERRVEPSFTRQEYGGEVDLGQRWLEWLRTSTFYRLRRSDAVDVSDEIPPELVDDVLLSIVGGSLLVERRDSIIDPTRGSSHRLTLEYTGSGLGSDLDFVRINGFVSWVFPLRWGLRLVATNRAGAMVRLASTEVIPIQERFFNGGESTIRSFPEDEAGPTISGEPIGGEAYTTHNLELRVPVPVPEGLQGAVFVDAGTLTERVEDFGGGRWLFGVGLGVRYLTPIGPARVDLGFNPDREEDEDLLTVHFGLGYPF